MTAQDAQSFLSMTYASVLIQVKRNFDKFMQLQLQSIKEAKVPKRTKCGLLCFVENFEEFATLIEGIFRKSERRTDLDKWYVRLVEAIFQGMSESFSLKSLNFNKILFCFRNKSTVLGAFQNTIPGNKDGKLSSHAFPASTFESYAVRELKEGGKISI